VVDGVELVIGDRQTGKTTVCIDNINSNQKNFTTLVSHCNVYVAIGSKASTVANIAKVLEEKVLCLHDYRCS
jgi:F-type H+-transporting ATPase subunit alpha